MTTLYIVTKIEFNYNDEVYYAESDAGHPIKCFRNKDKAKAFMFEQEVAFWFGGQKYGNNPSEYGYDSDEVYNEGWAEKVFPKEEIDCWKVMEEINPEEIESKMGEMYRDEFVDFTKDWPDSVKRKFVEHALCVNVYKVREVELDEVASGL